MCTCHQHLVMFKSKCKADAFISIFYPLRPHATQLAYSRPHDSHYYFAIWFWNCHSKWSPKWSKLSLNSKASIYCWEVALDPQTVNCNHPRYWKVLDACNIMTILDYNINSLGGSEYPLENLDRAVNKAFLLNNHTVFFHVVWHKPHFRIFNAFTFASNCKTIKAGHIKVLHTRECLLEAPLSRSRTGLHHRRTAVVSLTYF